MFFPSGLPSQILNLYWTSGHWRLFVLISCARLSWSHSAFESTVNSSIVSYRIVKFKFVVHRGTYCFPIDTDNRRRWDLRVTMVLYRTVSWILAENRCCYTPLVFTAPIVSDHVKILEHRVPKLATPLASNTLNSVWSSWISTKYCTLHCPNITYCRT